MKWKWRYKGVAGTFTISAPKHWCSRGGLLIEGLLQRNSDFFSKVHEAAAQISLSRERKSEISSAILVELRWNYQIRIYFSERRFFLIWVAVACVGNKFSVDTQFATWHIFATLANKIFLNTNITFKFFHCQISFVQEMYHPTMQQYQFMLAKLILLNLFSFLNGTFGPEDLTR